MSSHYHPFADLIDIKTYTISGGESLCRILTQEKLKNPQNAVHGGVIYSLADKGIFWRNDV